jgi:quercetin dioxygenase-like cupin family protein
MTTRDLAARGRTAIGLLLVLLASFASAVIAEEQDVPRGLALGRDTRSVTVTHGPVVTMLTTADSDAHQLGDLRVASLPLTAEDGSEGGRLDASLLTTGVDQPGAGDEIRISTLVFTLGDAADQVVVTGTGIYPAAGSTLAIDTTVVRPIVGGSGRFAGASGWAESEHLADDSWRHTLHLVAAPAGRVRAIPPGHLRQERLDKEQPATGTTTEPGIVRTLLGSTDTAAAEGETLGLWHYLIPAGSALAPHTHPGDQVARVVQGTLLYEVVAGEARVLRSDGSTETIGAGQATILEAGDAVIESAGMVHLGSNEGRRPVELVSATLFETGAEPATAVGSPAPLASPQPMESPAA